MFRAPHVQGFQPFGAHQQRHRGQPNIPQFSQQQWAPSPSEWRLQTATTRNPPSWAPEIEGSYPFRHWLQDAVIWCVSTPEDELRKGPQIELALGGLARELIREMPLEVKINGGLRDLGDGQGPQQLSGAAWILTALAERFSPLDEERNVTALADLYGFHRMSGEDIDQVLGRWEIVRQRAFARADR